MQRLTTREVCALARLSPATVWRRVRSGEFPKPVDYGRQALFDRSAIEQALRRAQGPGFAIAPKAALKTRGWSAARWSLPQQAKK